MTIVTVDLRRFWSLQYMHQVLEFYNVGKLLCHQSTELMLKMHNYIEVKWEKSKNTALRKIEKHQWKCRFLDFNRHMLRTIHKVATNNFDGVVSKIHFHKFFSQDSFF